MGGRERGGVISPAYTTMPKTLVVFLTTHPLSRRWFLLTMVRWPSESILREREREREREKEGEREREKERERERKREVVSSVLWLKVNHVVVMYSVPATCISCLPNRCNNNCHCVCL